MKSLFPDSIIEVLFYKYMVKKIRDERLVGLFMVYMSLILALIL